MKSYRSAPPRLLVSLGLISLISGVSVSSATAAKTTAPKSKVKTIAHKSSTTGSKSVDYAKTGQAHYKAHRYNEAIAALLKAVKANPDDDASQLALVKSYQESGRITAAAAHYRAALAQSPQRAGLHYGMGLVETRMNRLDDAIKQYQEAIRLQPSFAPAYNSMGLVYARKHQQKEAEASYKKALEKRPGYPQAYINLGTVYMETERYDDALKSYQEALHHQPDNADAYYNLGILSARQGMISDAEEDYKKAIQLNPEYFEAYHKLSHLYLDQGRFQEGVELGEKMLELRPNDPEAIGHMGNVALQVGDFQASVRYFEKAFEVGGGTEARRSSYASALYQLGRYQDAEKQYQQIIREDPKSAMAYSKLGLTYARLKDADRAVEFGKKAASLAPSDPAIQYNLGLVYQNVGKGTEALDAYQEAIRLKPNYHEAYLNRGVVLHNMGRKQESFDSYNEALKIWPEFPLALLNRGRDYLADHDYDKADNDFTELIRLQPDAISDPYISRGRTRLHLKQFNAAVEDLSKAIQLEPDPDRRSFPLGDRMEAYLILGRGADAGADAETLVKQLDADDPRAHAAAIIGALGYRQAGKPEAAKKLLAKIPALDAKSGWPYPVVRYLKREIGEKELLDAAASFGKDAPPITLAAHAFIGLDHLFASPSNTVKAKEHLDWVESHADPNLTEYFMASEALHRLNGEGAASSGK